MTAGEEVEAGPWGDKGSTGRVDDIFRHDSGILRLYSGQICGLASVYLRHEPLLIRARRSEFAKFSVDDIKCERGPSG